MISHRRLYVMLFLVSLSVAMFGCTPRLDKDRLPLASAQIGKVYSNRPYILTMAGGTDEEVGAYRPDRGMARRMGMSMPCGVVGARNKDIFVSSCDDNVVWVIHPSGMTERFAGLSPSVETAGYVPGNGGFGGDGGPATSARLQHPAGLTLDGAGRLYIADIGNHRVRRVSLDGTIDTVAGTGPVDTVTGDDLRLAGSYGGDGGPATRAQLNAPSDVAIDRQGNLIIADSHNNRIRMVDRQGIITTVAGLGPAGKRGEFGGDNGPATRAHLDTPLGIAFDPRGCLCIADTHNNRVRRIDDHGIILTIVGGGMDGKYARRNVKDGQSGRSVSLRRPSGLAYDPEGNLFLSHSNQLLKVNAVGMIRVLVNIKDHYGFSGDTPQPALTAPLNSPGALEVTMDGGLLICDRQNNRLRKITGIDRPASASTLTIRKPLDLHPK